MGDQAVDQLGRLAGAAEAANHDGGAIVDIGQRLKHAGTQFIDHAVSPCVASVEFVL